LPNNFPYHQR